MDFFDRQIRAKRRTRIFLLLYAAAFGVTAILLYVFVSFVLHLLGSIFFPWDRAFWDWEVFGWTCLGLAGFVGSVVGKRYLQLRRGGPAVAEMLRGEVLPETATDTQERRLHNVVEEMAIAAGIPKPGIYIFERERGINAFVAGFGPEDSIVGLTRGALMHLDRDEMQGVVAHEFSHILNGDMRLNLWMICLLHGLFAVHEAGREAVRSTWDEDSSTMTVRWDHRDGGLCANVVAVVGGMALIVIGYTGYLLARLVQCALSRQRERLADAAAVQFTRDPAVLAEALKKVGGWSRGGLIENPLAEEAGHIFFVDGINGTLERIFSTHPSLEDRIRLLDPSFDGRFPVILDERARRRSRIIQEVPVEVPKPTLKERLGMDRVQAQAIAAAIGRMEAGQLERSRALLDAIPAPVREAARDVTGAQAIVFLLLLSDPQSGPDEVSIPDDLAPEVSEKLLQIKSECGSLAREAKLALLELAVPALHRLGEVNYEDFRRRIGAVLDRSNPSLYRICVRRIVIHPLDRHFGRARPAARQVYSIGSLWDEIAVLLSALAAAGSKDPDVAWQAALSTLPLAYRRKERPSDLSPDEIRTALDRLHRLSPGILRRVIQAAVNCVASDEKLTADEAELLRALAAALGCPIPPILPVKTGEPPHKPARNTE